MQEDFHYYATYCAAILAGYTHEESLTICCSAQLVDCCSASFLKTVRGPKAAQTTQLQMELMDARTDIIGLQNITRIWASFHFLPGDLYAKKKFRTRSYMNKYRLICDTNSALLADTVKLARSKSLQAAGIAMHVLADTWAHRFFAGTPSLVINNTNAHFFEILTDGEQVTERKIAFRHSASAADDPESGKYTASLFQSSERSIMNLGHGRAGHLPDYSFIRYRYLPAWGEYREMVKDNPDDYQHAFSQMVYALEYLRGSRDDFQLNTYADEELVPYRDEIRAIIEKRQLNASADWKAFGEKLSGQTIPDFDTHALQKEYIDAGKEEKSQTFLGKFMLGAMDQKSMVTERIFRSGNLLAGISIDYSQKGFKGIKDFMSLIQYNKKEEES